MPRILPCLVLAALLLPLFAAQAQTSPPPQTTPPPSPVRSVVVSFDAVQGPASQVFK